jgi:hypothetical protein
LGLELQVLLARPDVGSGVVVRFDGSPRVPLDFVDALVHAVGQAVLLSLLIWRRGGSLQELGFRRSPRQVPPRR